MSNCVQKNEKTNAAPGSGAPIWPLAFVTFVDAIGLGLLVPMLAFFVQDLGASASAISQLVGLYALGAFVGGPLLGALSDRVERRWVVAFSLVGLGISYVGMAVSSSLFLIFAFRAFGGLMAGNETVVQAIASQNVSETESVKRIGYIGAARGAGMVLGPVLGGVGALLFFSEQAYYRWTLYSAAMLCLVAFSLVILFVNDSGRRSRRVTEQKSRDLLGEFRSAKGKSLVWLLALTAAIAFAFGTLQSITALYVQAAFGWGPAGTGQVLGLCAALIVISRLYFARLAVQSLGRDFTLLASFFIACFAMSVLSANPPPWGLMLLYGAFCTAYGVSLIVTTSGIALTCSDRNRGVFLGFNQAVFSGAIVFSASVSGPLFEFVGISAPYALAALALFIPGVVLARTVVAQPSPISSSTKGK